MEALFIILIAGIVLLIPVGSILGFLAFRQRSDQASRIESLGREVSALREEVVHLRRQMVSEDDVPASHHDESVEPAPVKQAPPSQDVAAATDSASSDWIEPAQPVVRSERPEPDRVSRLTAALKENWMVWLGGLSVGLAGIFMVSHSINAGLIGPVQQLLLALFTGLALHAGAEFLRRRNRGADQVFAALAGGGSITLYAALLAGVHHYELISPLTGLVGLAAVSLGTMVLALVHGPLLAIMGLSGAYLVPLLIGSEDGSVAFVLSYSFLITLSSLLLMRYVFRDWLWFATLAGALLWWLVTLSSAPVGASTAWYIAGLFVVFAILPGNLQAGAPRLRETLLTLLAIWGLSIADQPADSPLFWSWLLILPVAALVPQSRGAFWYLPWTAVAASAAGWLAYMVREVADRVYLEQMPMAISSPMSTVSPRQRSIHCSGARSA